MWESLSGLQLARARAGRGWLARRPANAGPVLSQARRAAHHERAGRRHRRPSMAVERPSPHACVQACCSARQTRRGKATTEPGSGGWPMGRPHPRSPPTSRASKLAVPRGWIVVTGSACANGRLCLLGRRAALAAAPLPARPKAALLRRIAAARSLRIAAGGRGQLIAPLC